MTTNNVTQLSAEAWVATQTGTNQAKPTQLSAEAWVASASTSLLKATQLSAEAWVSSTAAMPVTPPGPAQDPPFIYSYELTRARWQVSTFSAPNITISLLPATGDFVTQISAEAWVASPTAIAWTTQLSAEAWVAPPPAAAWVTQISAEAWVAVQVFPPPPFNYVMDLPPRGPPPRPPDFTSLNINLLPIPPVPFRNEYGLPLRAYWPIPEIPPLNILLVPPRLFLAEHLTIVDAYTVGSARLLVLEDRLEITDAFTIVTTPVVTKKAKRRYQIIDPRFMTLEHWSRMTRETLLQAGFVPVFTDQAGWQQWAQYVRQLPDLAGIGIPDPRGYSDDDWVAWAHRLNEALLNAQ